MIYFLVGLPGRFAELCDTLAFRLAERHLGSSELAEFKTLNELACAIIRTDARHLVAALRHPVVQLQEEIARSGRPFVVALDDVYTAVAELMSRGGYDLVSATREIATSCGGLLALASAPGALLLSSHRRQEPVELADAIARHFGFALDRQEIVDVTASINAPTGGERSPLDVHNEVVAGALEPYVRFFNNGGELEPIVWQPDLFLTTGRGGDGSTAPARGPVDITGRPRFLIFGPYINLSPGPWSATVAIGFSAETAGMSFGIEITAGTQLASAQINPAGEQVIETSLNFTIGATIDHPVEIRILNERAAFDGRIALGSVRLTPQIRQQSDADLRLIESLRRLPH